MLEGGGRHMRLVGFLLASWHSPIAQEELLAKAQGPGKSKKQKGKTAGDMPSRTDRRDRGEG